MEAMRLIVSTAMLQGESSRRVCMKCRSVDRVETVAPGSPATELLLWLLVIPGPVYSWWRWKNKRPICAVCGNADLLPEDAPLVRQSFPELSIPRTPKSAWEIARDTLFVLVIGAGVSFVAALAISVLFPGVRQSRWFSLFVVVPAIVITAHPLITVFHLVLHLLRPEKQRPHSRQRLCPCRRTSA
jgi:hypothetical protein